MEVRLDDIIVSKSGDSNGGENCNLYGQNAALLVKGGATATISNIQLTSSAKGGSGVFSYGGSNVGKGDGTRVDLLTGTITTSGDDSGGVVVSGGGEMHVKDLNVSTSGSNSSPIKSDKGGGIIEVSRGTYVASGVASPAVHAVADTSITESSLISHSSPGAVLKGKHKLTIADSIITANNTELRAPALQRCGILVHDPDIESGTAQLVIKNTTLTNLVGHAIHVTATTSKLSFEGATIYNHDPNNILLSVTNDGWSGLENAATVEFRQMEVSGKIVVDNTPVGGAQQQSKLDLTLASGAIFTGSINQGVDEANRGAVNLIVRQGAKFILKGTSYVDSLINNGKVICGNYDLYVNGEKYDDSGDTKVTESSLVLDGTSYKLQDDYGKLVVEQSSKSKAITATIKRSGQFTFSGSGVNTAIRVASRVKDVIIILSDLTLDNSNYEKVTGKDASTILLEPEADAKIIVEGESTIIGPSTYYQLPRAIIRGTESNLVFEGSGKLSLIDSMPEDTIFHDEYPDCIHDYKGTVVVSGGTYRLRSNGSALKAPEGALFVDGGTLNVEYAGQDAVNADDGLVTISSGRLDVSESRKCGISATCISNTNAGSVIISGGETRLYKIAGSGIRGENILVSGGQLDITTIYSRSGDAIYVPGDNIDHHITVVDINETLQRTRVNYYAGEHHGIEAGTRGMKYSYLDVPKSDSDHKVGEVYERLASGSVSIIGGMITIDTRITGIITNILLSPEGVEPCSDNIYRIGAPGSGIMSYGTAAISGGMMKIQAGGNGIECDGSITINQEVNLNIELAYNCLECADLIVGSDSNLSTTYMYAGAVNSAVRTRSSSYTYTYDSSEDETRNYTIDRVTPLTGSNMYGTGGQFTGQIDVTKIISVILRSGDPDEYVKKEYQYRPNGHVINCNGYIWINSGEFTLFGADSIGSVPVKQTGGFLANSRAMLLITGVDDNEESMPRYGSAAFVRAPEGASWEPWAKFKIDTLPGNPIYRTDLFNGGTFLLFSHPELDASHDYDVTIGDKHYILPCNGTLNGGSL